MVQILTYCHSIMRWLVLLSLLFALIRAFRGYLKKLSFTRTDNAIRHWTATIAHIQLMLGILLYTQSPVIKYFWKNFSDAKENMDNLFFGIIHITFMLTAIVLITVGSALAKRKMADEDKFRTMLLWFVTALILIFVAIPWPFSPLASRPYFR